MGYASRRWALNLVIYARGTELREEVVEGLPKILRLVLEDVELQPGDSEVVANAVIGDIDGSVVHMTVGWFTLDELAERYPGLGLAW